MHKSEVKKGRNYRAEPIIWEDKKPNLYVVINEYISIQWL